MGRVRLVVWSLLGVTLACATALGVTIYYRMRAPVRAKHVPAGDHEIAWFHTAANFSTWERFVAGAKRAARQDARLTVDDTNAFLDQTTAVPELVIGAAGHSSKLRIRWYKQSSQATVADWVGALTRRDPPPLAILGGGSSDRAQQLATVLQERTQWRGARPLLLITTATAVLIEDEPTASFLNLMEVYPGRSFRFCFNNEQIAKATLDFVSRDPELRPQRAGGPPAVFALEWRDDPYSIDLAGQFRLALVGREPRVDFHHWSIRHSIGGAIRPNRHEAEAIEQLLSPTPRLPLRYPLPRGAGDRSLLVLPAVTGPARRVLGALTAEVPRIGRHVVAVTGDSIAFNTLYRDADVAWDSRRLPVTLVGFAHENPVAWEDERPDPARRASGLLTPTTGTDDVLHFATAVRRLCESILPEPGSDSEAKPVTDADALAQRLRGLIPPLFDEFGNRLRGQGETILLLRPPSIEDDADRAPSPASLEVWTRPGGSEWKLLRRLPIDPSRR
jgi:hypothetical protein